MSLFPADLHHRVHVVGLPEAVPEAHKEEQPEDPTSVLEEMVHADIVSFEVTKYARKIKALIFPKPMLIALSVICTRRAARPSFTAT